MKKFVSTVLLCALLLCACAPQPSAPSAEATDAPAAEPTTAPTEPETTEATEPAMSEAEAQAILQERRDIVEAEMRHMMSVLWRCDEDFVYEYRTIRAGRIYSGIPYTHGSSSTAAFLSYGEPGEDGVYDLTGLTVASVTGTSGTSLTHSARVGNDCNDAVFWSWAKISPTITFSRCLQMTEAPWAADSLEECTIDKLYAGKITSNYRISHVTVSIVGENGQPVQSATCYVREDEKYCFQMKMFRVDSVLGVLQGELDLDALPAGSYTCTVSCHISTGEDIIVRQFSFHK